MTGILGTLGLRGGLARTGLRSALGLLFLDRRQDHQHVATVDPRRGLDVANVFDLLGDLYMSGQHDRAVLKERDAVVRRLARLARRSLGLPSKEVVAAVNMVVAIPEEAGTLLFTQEANPVLVRDLCRTLVLSAIKGLRSVSN